nr:hypothetical protein [Tanacetum cinerariifolium]
MRSSGSGGEGLGNRKRGVVERWRETGRYRNSNSNVWGELLWDFYIVSPWGWLKKTKKRTKSDQNGTKTGSMAESGK